MSYCRFSSDNFKCDIYCYESEQGFVTHTAASRHAIELPECPTLTTLEQLGYEKYDRLYRYFDEAFNDSAHIPINDEFAGKTFTDPDLESFRDRLIMLREHGYRFPNDVLETINKEMAE